MLSVCFASSCKWHSCLISHDVINWNRNLEDKRRGERTQKNILKKRQKLGLGRWLRWKVLGALPEDQGFWFLAPTAPTQGNSALPRASTPKDTKPSTGLCGYCPHMRSLHFPADMVKNKGRMGQLQLTGCSPIRDWCRKALWEFQFTEELVNLHFSSSKWIIKSCKTREGVVRS